MVEENDEPVAIPNKLRDMPKTQSEVPQHQTSKKTNLKKQGKAVMTAVKDHEVSMEKTGGDASTSNYSAIKLGLQGLRNDEVTEDSIVTETDLNTLNTGKVMAAMIKKGDLPA